MSQIKYEGSELDIFAAVHNWKTYWAASIRQSIRGDVLEAGAGIGSNYPYHCAGHSGRWVCLEPDPKLVD
ncbi:MAG: hypothetical protein KGN79_12325 [Acidobacteriota bacterium]|nr:hypothetical protein [Acidobacteriota bacterium]